MASKIKNIIIFTVIAVVLILIYIFFIKPAPVEQNLISSSPSNTILPNKNTVDQNSLIAKDFLSVLLNVKNIKLDDTIFSDGSFTSLRDSSIFLTSPGPGDQGRLNPFAPIGSDAVAVPPVAPVVLVAPVLPIVPVVPLTCALPKVLNTTTNTCVTPPPPAP
ncbi:MAG: hypothetical protein AAB913_02765 [Patescibacteria group bacterium]